MVSRRELLKLAAGLSAAQGAFALSANAQEQNSIRLSLQQERPCARMLSSGWNFVSSHSIANQSKR